ncbi:threonine/serine ThrE exporter family protein [Acidipropionibacterium virtanenii]|uniref:threonine/serine ThrE exporter family protein n=1 Tax=Acidipropionibacterium virtanenii TaxID=2057246 RepID=UPI0011BE85EF|nr:threonine/serine exporter family protein [Acidipropionibacterium virtanenii]
MSGQRGGTPRSGRGWRGPLNRYLRDGHPLSPSRDLASVREDEMAAAQAREVFDLIMRITVMAVSVGASSAEAIAMGLRIADAYGINVHVDITNTSVIVTQHRSLDDDPITALRVVRTRTADYQRLGRLEQLVDDVSHRRGEPAGARERLNDLMTAPRLYKKWFVTVNMGVMGAAMAALYGASVLDVLIAFLATCLVDVAVQGLARRRVANFFVQAVGGAIPTAVALGMMLLRTATGMRLDLSPSLVVAAGMISLLAGTGAVAAAQDALDGYYVTSSGRFLEVIMQTGGIAFGVMTTLWLGLKLGVPGYISPTLVWTSAPWVQIVASAIASIAFGATSHSGPRTLGVTGLLGALGWAGYLVGMRLTDSMVIASGFGACLIGLVSASAAKRWRVPQVALVTIAVVPLMPGMMLYRGLYMVMAGQLGIPAPDDGTQVLAQSLLVGVALAAGSSLGALAARPIAIPADHRTRRAVMASWFRGSAVPRDWVPRRHRRRTPRPAPETASVPAAQDGSGGRDDDPDDHRHRQHRGQPGAPA